jgi:hypothetical protein
MVHDVLPANHGQRGVVEMAKEWPHELISATHDPYIHAIHKYTKWKLKHTLQAQEEIGEVVGALEGYRCEAERAGNGNRRLRCGT